MNESSGTRSARARERLSRFGGQGPRPGRGTAQRQAWAHRSRPPRRLPSISRPVEGSRTTGTGGVAAPSRHHRPKPENAVNCLQCAPGWRAPRAAGSVARRGRRGLGSGTGPAARPTGLVMPCIIAHAYDSGPASADERLRPCAHQRESFCVKWRWVPRPSSVPA
jgi:hypothetical protein